MRHTLLIALNTLRVTFRARSKILVYFVLPVGGVVLSLFVHFASPARPARVGVVDEDRGRFALELVASVNAWGGYATSVVALRDLDVLIADGKLDCGLLIPTGYSEGLARGEAPRVRLVSLKGDEVTAWLEQSISLYSSTISGISAASAGNRDAFERMHAALGSNAATLSVNKVRDLSAGKRITLSSLGFLAYFILLGAAITAQLVLAERRAGTYSRIRKAPVRAGQFIAGNGLAGLAIIVFQIVAILLLMSYVFRVETYVPAPLLFAILFLFGLAGIGLALAIAAFARSSLMSNVLMNLILTPTSMVAGCFWPARIMPAFLQRLAHFMPQWWMLDAVERLQIGATVASIGANLLAIAGFALAFLLLASYRFVRIEEAGVFV